MAKLYANENFPGKVVQALRALGHDVLTSYEAGKANQSISDLDVLTFATENNRTLLTINRRNFIALHEKGFNHGGMIVCTQDPDIQGQAQRIHEAVLNCDSLAGHLIRVNRPQR